MGELKVKLGSVRVENVAVPLGLGLVCGELKNGSKHILQTARKANMVMDEPRTSNQKSDGLHKSKKKGSEMQSKIQEHIQEEILIETM